MKKYDKEFFILLELENKNYYDSCIGVDNLAKILGKTRLETLRSINNYMKNDTYIKNKDNKKFILFDKFILERGNKNDRKRHKIIK